ncbi:MAG: glutathione peroxidase [Gammaproteobacteria bacterium]|nr:glutathione peroxidase [Gammaproteobacteria bacterium]
MHKIALLIGSLLLTPCGYAQETCAPWLDHSLKKLHDPDMINLCAATSGKPVLLVNTASHCGFTHQFGGLEELHKKYQEQGLVIIGFPSDSFNQAAETAEEAARICYYNFGVSFLMTEQISVNGDTAHPIFKHLAQHSEVPGWNFNKYLINQQGDVVAHYSHWTGPGSWRLARAIEKLL